MSEEQEKQARDMIRQVFEDQEATINGRVYRFTKMTHKKRRKVFAFFTRFGGQMRQQDFSFLDSPEFEPVEAVINDAVVFNDSLLSRLGDSHWEEYPDDYLPFIGVALAVISYPFMPANPTG